MEINHNIEHDVFVLYQNQKPILAIPDFSQVRSAKVEQHTDKIYLAGSYATLQVFDLQISIKGEYSPISCKFHDEKQAENAMQCVISELKRSKESQAEVTNNSLT